MKKTKFKNVHFLFAPPLAMTITKQKIYHDSTFRWLGKYGHQFNCKQNSTINLVFLANGKTKVSALSKWTSLIPHKEHTIILLMTAKFLRESDQNQKWVWTKSKINHCFCFSISKEMLNWVSHRTHDSCFLAVNGCLTTDPIATLQWCWCFFFANDCQTKINRIFEFAKQMNT